MTFRFDTDQNIGLQSKGRFFTYVESYRSPPPPISFQGGKGGITPFLSFSLLSLWDFSRIEWISGCHIRGRASLISFAYCSLHGIWLAHCFG